MKKRTLTFRAMTLLLFSFLAVSCGDDDDDTPRPNELEYNNAKYGLNQAFTVDFGPFGFVRNSNTHYFKAFALVDTVGPTVQPKVTLELYLLSAGTASFKAGTFAYGDLSKVTSDTEAEAKFKTQNVFVESSFYIDANGDGDTEDNEEEFMITGGTIRVSGAEPNYTIDCDLQLENNKGVKAFYAGEVAAIPIDLDDDDDVKTNLRKAPSTAPFHFKKPGSLRVN
ncbi:hypothetical protein ACD591_14195 [Rufibacter glacialis]|uniref:Uncharacterized protein n=1 Tax=Rufibacter glacialis TaxID=1259555 RepID=A0A5M8Q7T5_9BACT|nr:hypothetical protein [Rufibacter glacialis]KAA6431004.1 hypothetical protein FOE74_18030 [Rufibacter glacialis]GGK83225.1 hypothetical protein GCM10011405_33840 [Rufibacter glacialis]